MALKTYGNSNSIDTIFDEVALADGSSAAAAIEGAPFHYVKSNWNTRIMVIAATEITVAATKILKADILQSATSTGTFVYAASALNLVAPTGDKVYAIGDIVAEIVIPDNMVTSGNYIRLDLTVDEDQTAAKVTAYTTNCY